MDSSGWEKNDQNSISRNVARNIEEKFKCLINRFFLLLILFSKY